MRRASCTVMIPLFAALLACNRNAPEPEVEIVPYEGVYRITEYHRAEGNCDDPGPALGLDDLREPFVMLFHNESAPLHSGPLVDLRGCPDEATCQANVADMRDGGMGPSAELFVYLSDVEPNVAHGQTSRSGFWNPGTGICEQGGRELAELVREGDTIRLDVRSWVADYTPENRGECFTDQGADAAEDHGTCEAFIRLTAERIGGE